MSETCRGHLWDKIIIKLFASSWYIFLTYIYDARSHLYQIAKYFAMDGDLVSCNVVYVLMEELQLQFHPESWRLFTDSSKVNLKAVLLHKGNKHPAVALANAAYTKEICAIIYGLLKKCATKTTGVLTWKLWQCWLSRKEVIRSFVVSCVQGTGIARFSSGDSKEKRF